MSTPGFISYDNFIKEVALLAGISKRDAHLQIEDNLADEALFAYIRTHIKPSYKVGLLSNAGDNWLTELFSTEQLELFEATALSCEIGAIKPHPAAYQTIAKRLGVNVEECIFIDDQPRYCQAAREAGMQAIDYKGLKELQTAIELALAPLDTLASIAP